ERERWGEVHLPLNDDRGRRLRGGLAQLREQAPARGDEDANPSREGCGAEGARVLEREQRHQRELQAGGRERGAGQLQAHAKGRIGGSLGGRREYEPVITSVFAANSMTRQETSPVPLAWC